MEIHFYLYFALFAVNLFHGIFHFRSLQPPYKTLVFLLLITLVEEALIRVLHARGINPYPVYHYYAPVQYLFFCIIYSQFNRQKRIVRLYSLLTVPLLLVFTVVNRMYFEDKENDFPTHVLQAMSVLILVHILYTYRQMLLNFSPVPLYKQHLFWFNTANLLYFTCNFFYWAFFNERDKGQTIELFLKVLQATFTLTTYVLYGLGLYLSPKTKPA